MTLYRLLVFLCYLPWVYLKSKNVDDLAFRDRFSIIQKLCQTIIKNWKIKLTVNISEKIDHNETYYLVSNHQGTFDPIFLVASSPVANSFISKEENLKLPVIGTWGRKIEFITFKRNDFDENVQMLRQSMRFLKEKKSLLVFPEGTRSRQQAMLDFKVGAFLPAYGAKVKILPVTLCNSYKMDEFNSNIKEIIITYHDPIEVSEYVKLSYSETAEKVRDIIESVL